MLLSRVHVCTLSLGRTPGRGDTAGPSPSPPPPPPRCLLLHHLFMTNRPCDHTSHGDVPRCHLSFHQSLETRLPRSRRKKSTNLGVAPHKPLPPDTTPPPPPPILGPNLHDCQPVQESSRTAAESPWHPQPKRSIQYVPTQTGIDMFPHTLTHTQGKQTIVRVAAAHSSAHESVF